MKDPDAKQRTRRLLNLFYTQKKLINKITDILKVNLLPHVQILIHGSNSQVKVHGNEEETNDGICGNVTI